MAPRASRVAHAHAQQWLRGVWRPAGAGQSGHARKTKHRARRKHRPGDQRRKPLADLSAQGRKGHGHRAGRRPGRLGQGLAALPDRPQQNDDRSRDDGRRHGRGRRRRGRCVRRAAPRAVFNQADLFLGRGHRCAWPSTNHHLPGKRPNPRVPRPHGNQSGQGQRPWPVPFPPQPQELNYLDPKPQTQQRTGAGNDGLQRGTGHLRRRHVLRRRLVPQPRVQRPHRRVVRLQRHLPERRPFSWCEKNHPQHAGRPQRSHARVHRPNRAVRLLADV